MTLSVDQIKMLIDSVIAVAAILGLFLSFFVNRKTLSEIKNQRLMASRPVLSQKIMIEDKSVAEFHEIHFILKVKNFGVGTAFNQTFIDYNFYNNEEIIIERKSNPIMGAYDNIEPLKERPLDLSIFFPNDWEYNPEGIIINGIHSNFIEIRLPYEDIQGNKCCSCTKYTYNKALSGLYGKIERYNWYSASSEFSDERCMDCIWKNSSNNLGNKEDNKQSRLWLIGVIIGVVGNMLVSSAIEIAGSSNLVQVLWIVLFTLSFLIFMYAFKESAQILGVSTVKINRYTALFLVFMLVWTLIQYLLIPYLS